MPELPEVETTVRGLARHLEGARIAYVGDANNVARSLAEACSLSGAELVLRGWSGFVQQLSFLAAETVTVERMTKKGLREFDARAAVLTALMRIDAADAGRRLLARLRERGDALPVLLLTARDAVADRVEGLNRGAYLVTVTNVPTGLYDRALVIVFSLMVAKPT